MEVKEHLKNARSSKCSKESSEEMKLKSKLEPVLSHGKDHALCCKGNRETVLVCSGYYNKNTIDWGVEGWGRPKQPTFISHSPRGWEIQYQGTCRLGVWCGPASCFINGDFSLCPHIAEGVRDLSEVFFIRALILSMRALPSWPMHLPKVLPVNTIILGLEF